MDSVSGHKINELKVARVDLSPPVSQTVITFSSINFRKKKNYVGTFKLATYRNDNKNAINVES